MNFFEHQAKARSSSTRMVLLFALAVGGIVLVVDLVVLLLLGTQMESAGGTAALLLVSTVGTVAVIGLGSMYRMASLRGGGESVALQMARPRCRKMPATCSCAACATWSRKSPSPPAYRCPGSM